MLASALKVAGRRSFASFHPIAYTQAAKTFPMAGNSGMFRTTTPLVTRDTHQFPMQQFRGYTQEWVKKLDESNPCNAAHSQALEHTKRPLQHTHRVIYSTLQSEYRHQGTEFLPYKNHKGYWTVPVHYGFRQKLPHRGYDHRTSYWAVRVAQAAVLAHLTWETYQTWDSSIIRIWQLAWLTEDNTPLWSGTFFPKKKSSKKDGK